MTNKPEHIGKTEVTESQAEDAHVAAKDQETDRSSIPEKSRALDLENTSGPGRAGPGFPVSGLHLGVKNLGPFWPLTRRRYPLTPLLPGLIPLMGRKKAALCRARLPRKTLHRPVWRGRRGRRGLRLFRLAFPACPGRYLPVKQNLVLLWTLNLPM